VQSGTGGAQAGTSGLAPNVAAALSYVLGWITGLIFVLIEKENSFVRFHAFQSILYSVAWIAVVIAWNILIFIVSMASSVLGLLVGLLGILFWLVAGLGGFALWIILIIKAAQGDTFKLPMLGDMAERLAKGQSIS
jgi:uncharacterized membrane protein